MTGPLDPIDPRRWIGREDIAEDILTETLVARFCAALPGAGAAAGHAMPAPRLIHFCLCQPAAPTGELDVDGHPARGDFLPAVPLPRRMWAGSEILFHGDLHVGDVVRRRSRIADIVVKQGRTGALCFVTVDHAVTVDGRLRVEDRQTIVYRDATAPDAASAAAVAPQGETSVTVVPTPLLLFRYSALTFNSHRIHYDAPYAREVEGYPGLVVHGPLQATLLLQLAARVRGRQPDRFGFRSLSPLYGGEAMRLHAAASEGDGLTLWTARADGPVAMRAEAIWR